MRYRISVGSRCGTCRDRAHLVRACHRASRKLGIPAKGYTDGRHDITVYPPRS